MLDRAERRRRALRASSTADSADLVSLIEAYMELQRETHRPISRHTRRTYRRVVSILLERWLGAAFLKPDEQAARLFLQDLERAGASHASLKVYVAAGRALYNALRWAEVTESDPFASVRVPRDESGLSHERQTYSKAERQQLLSFAAPVDRALILLCTDLGLRVSECVGLTRDDADLEKERLKVSTAAGSSKSVGLTDVLIEALTALPKSINDSLLGFTSDVRARQRLQRLCSRAGVVYRGLDGLRPPRARRQLGEIGSEDNSHKSPRNVVLSASRKQSLENLPSAEAFGTEVERAVAQARRAGTQVGILLFAVDQMADIRTRYGQAMADTVLSAIIGRTRQMRRAYDFVAHIGDDCLAVLLVNIPSRVVLSRLAHQFSSAIRVRPVEIRGQMLNVTVSVAISLGDTDPHRLLAEAQRALLPAQSRSGLDRNDALSTFRQALDAFNRRDPGDLQRTLAEDAEVRIPGVDEVWMGREEIVRGFREWLQIFPDLHGDIIQPFVFGDQGLVEVLWTGTQQGELVLNGTAIAPNGRHVAVPVHTIFSSRQGKLRRLTHYVDCTALLGQLQADANAVAAASTTS